MRNDTLCGLKRNHIATVISIKKTKTEADSGYKYQHQKFFSISVVSNYMLTA